MNMIVLRAGGICSGIRRQCHGQLSCLTSSSSLECPLIQASPAPQRAGNVDGVDPRMLPPSALITGAMHLAVMDTAKWDYEFIAHFPAQRAWLHEA